MITEYHRPGTLEEALALLRDADAVPLAGGTSLIGRADLGSIRVVDLQVLPLDAIEHDVGITRFGATTRLQEIVDDEVLPPTLRDAARREGPRSIRNAATIGGTIAVADPESELVACLLALDAVVSVAHEGTTSERRLEEILTDTRGLSGGLITAVSFPAGGRLAADRTGRTPMDRPIVAAVAHRGPDELRVAVCGVADHPVIVEPDAIADLAPPSDFRGSADYRRTLAGVLVDRVLAAVGADR